MTKKGEKHKPETKQKISNSRKGKPAWNIGKQTSDLGREIIGLGMKKTFNWIEDEKLMKIIRRDFATAQACEKHNLIKPAIILYSAVAEAVLGYKLKDPQKEFSYLIKKAFEDGLIKEHIKDKLNVIRDFRNYVHIYKELLNNIDLNPGLAQLSREVCNSLIEMFKKNKT